MLSNLSRGAILACAVAVSLSAQAPDPQSPTAQNPAATTSSLFLRYNTFDPTVSEPSVPENLRSAKGQNLRIVQFANTPTQADRDGIAEAGGKVIKYLPANSYVVRLTSAQMANVGSLASVR